MAGMTGKLKELMERAETWPEEAQDELLRAGQEIESSQLGAYRATAEELEAIDLADSAQSPPRMKSRRSSPSFGEHERRVLETGAG